MDSKTKRDRLAVRREPHWVRIRAGAHLGYRKLAEGDGTWIAKHRNRDGVRVIKSLGTVAAEGKRDAYEIALKRALQWFDDLDRGISPHGDTIESVCLAYVESLTTERPGAAADAAGRFKRLVYGKPIGRIMLSELRAADVRAWRDGMVAQDTDPDDVRRSKDSANRNLTALKAALNLAYADQRVGSDHAWRGVGPFSGVGARRTVYLTVEERRRLLAACDEHLARLVKAALLTAARPGELAALAAGDFDKVAGTLTLNGKTGRRTVPLSRPARDLFADCAKDRLAKAPLLTRDGSTAWDRFYWRDKFRAAVKTAKLPADLVLYSLRHVAITDLLTGGELDVLTVARLSGTSLTMIDKHYGHLVAQRTATALDRVQAF